MKIAVAEDEKIERTYLRCTLQSVLPQAEVCAFPDGQALLQAAESTGFDIAFLDIHMPGMNGIELARELVRRFDSINIIFVTHFDGYQSEAMELFASGYVKKPLTREKIEEQLRHLRHPLYGSDGQKRKNVFPS